MANFLGAATRDHAAPIAAVQWLRAVAAIMVVAHHALYYTNDAAGTLGLASVDVWGFDSWWFGIHLFFVISGFLMIHTTPNFGVPGAWRVFLVRRVVRVVPLYWIMTTISVLAVLRAPDSVAITVSKIPYILGSYLFIPVLRSAGDLRPILGQGWTLDYEMFFYAAFAIAMVFPRRWGVAGLTVAFVILGWLGRSLGPDTPIAFTWTDGLIFEFLFGVYLGLLHDKGQRLSGWLAAGSIGVGIALVVLDVKGPTALVCGVPAALILGGFVLGPRLRDTAATRWLSVLGDASYSLYLTHTFVIRPLHDVWLAQVGTALPVSMLLIGMVVLSIAFGVAVNVAIERPLTRMLLGKTSPRVPSGRRAKAPAPTVVGQN